MSIRGILNRKIGIGNCTDISFVSDRAEAKAARQAQVGAEKELEQETVAGVGYCELGYLRVRSICRLIVCVACSMQRQSGSQTAACCVLTTHWPYLCIIVIRTPEEYDKGT